VIRYLALSEVLALHADLLASSGGAAGVRDLGRVQAALAQPVATFDGVDLYPTVVAKAAALGFSLIQGHPFVDGNKRIGHAAMEVFLVLNGHEISASVDEQERVVLAVASGEMTREGLTEWLQQHALTLGEPA
jgi:death on curing protein